MCIYVCILNVCDLYNCMCKCVCACVLTEARVGHHTPSSITSHYSLETWSSI